MKTSAVTRGPAETIKGAEQRRLPAFIPEFDGIRGLAVSAVMLYHFQGRLAGVGLSQLAAFGWVGVNLFFVLSGFLITRLLIAAKGKPNYFRNFYARRLLRIWPLYFALLLFSWTVGHLIGGSLGESLRQTNWFTFLLLLQNLGSASIPGPLIQTWSLAVEEHFYLVWAPLVRFSSRRTLLISVGLIAVLSPVLRTALSGRLAGVNTLFNLDGVSFGALLALLYNPDSRRRWGGIGVLLSAVGLLGIAFDRFEPTPLLFTWLACLFSGAVVFVLLSLDRNSLFGRFLRLRSLRYLGTISYGLYLLHPWAGLLVSTAGIDRYFYPWDAVGGMIGVGIRIAISVGLATASWFLLEHPILRFKSRFGPQVPNVIGEIRADANPLILIAR